MEYKTLRPSTNRTLWWIIARRIAHISERSLDRDTKKQTSDGVGKFLIFEHRRDVDQAWEKIKEATEDGKLSFGAKVSTRRGKASWKGNQPEDDHELKHVICVYTDGSEAEKQRVKASLYELGFVRHLPYKSDAATIRGENGAAGAGDPKTGACLKISKCGGNSLQIMQLFPHQDPPPTVFFSKEMIDSIADSIYKAGNMVPPPVSDKEKHIIHDGLHLKIYGQRLDNFKGKFCFIIEVGRNKVQFLQEDAMFCYGRFLWYKRNYLKIYDAFDSEEEGDYDFSRSDDCEWLPSNENDDNSEAVREYIRTVR